MLEDYILPDIIRYIFNLYLDYANDIPKLENLTNIKFDKEPHVTVEELYDPKLEMLLEQKIYLDHELIKDETWYGTGQKCHEYNYWNKENHGIHIQFFDDGKIYSEMNYIYGKLDGRKFIYDGTHITVKEYKKDIQNGKQFVYTSDGELFHELNYLDGKKDGVQYEWRKKYNLYRTEVNKYKNGTIVRKTMYHASKIQTTDLSQLIKMTEINFKNGYIDVEQYFWDKNEILIQSRCYENKKLVETKKFRDGKLIETIKN
jgi:antitoxin component YwqK of YwqJK toxin-antitoxin module